MTTGEERAPAARGHAAALTSIRSVASTKECRRGGGCHAGVCRAVSADLMSGPRALLVEDTEEFVAIGRRLLENEGYLVTVARDGAEAVRYLVSDETHYLTGALIPVAGGLLMM